MLGCDAGICDGRIPSHYLNTSGWPSVEWLAWPMMALPVWLPKPPSFTSLTVAFCSIIVADKETFETMITLGLVRGLGV